MKKEKKQQKKKTAFSLALSRVTASSEIPEQDAFIDDDGLVYIPFNMI